MKKIFVLVLIFLVLPYRVDAVMQSLNGLNNQNQLFVNDTNVRITSSGNSHALGWNGLLPVSRGGTGANSLTNLINLGLHTVGNYIESITGSSQISVGGSGSESAGVSLGIVPGSLGGNLFDTIDGNSPSDENCLTYEEGGNNGSIEWQPCSITTSPGGLNTEVQFNDNGVFGADNAFTWDKANKTLNLTAENDNPSLQIIVGGNEIGSFSGIKLWDNTPLRQRVRKVLSAGEGTLYQENISMFASGYMSIVPQGSIAYGATILNPNSTTGFQASRGGTSGQSPSVYGLFSASQSVDDPSMYGFYVNLNNTNGGGLLIKGKSSYNNNELGKNLTIWGNTSGNTNKAISIGNGINFTERMYISNDGTINTTGNVFVGNTIHVGSNTIPGCVAIGDSDGDGITYLTANDGVLSASSTQPSNCQ